MKKKIVRIIYVGLTLLIPTLFFAFTNDNPDNYDPNENHYKKYVKVKLTSSRYEKLKDWEKAMIPRLIQAARIMDRIFWKQAFSGDRDSLLNSAKNDAEREY